MLGVGAVVAEAIRCGASAAAGGAETTGSLAGRRSRKTVASTERDTITAQTAMSTATLPKGLGCGAELFAVDVEVGGGVPGGITGGLVR